MMTRRQRRRQGWRRLRRRLLLALLVLAVLPLVLWRWPQLALEVEFARQRWQAGAAERDVQIDDHRWRYLEAGSGPPLLLIHGFTGSKENWLPVMGVLAQRFRVIAPDLPGWGDSQRIEDGDYGFAAQAQRMDRFRAAVVGDDAALAVVGHSMGGGIAALWAGAQPPSLQRLVLMDAAGVPFDNAFAQAIRRGEHPFEVLDELGFKRQIDWVFDSAPWIPWPADQAFIQQRRAQAPFERAVLQAIAGDEARAFAPGEAAYGISAPTLLFWCRGDKVIDISAAAVYAQRIADSTQVTLDGCNHMPMMERPVETANVLLEFLATPP